MMNCWLRLSYKPRIEAFICLYLKNIQDITTDVLIEILCIMDLAYWIQVEVILTKESFAMGLKMVLVLLNIVIRVATKATCGWA